LPGFNLAKAGNTSFAITTRDMFAARRVKFQFSNTRPARSHRPSLIASTAAANPLYGARYNAGLSLAARARRSSNAAFSDFERGKLLAAASRCDNVPIPGCAKRIGTPRALPVIGFAWKGPAWAPRMTERPGFWRGITLRILYGLLVR
jgi:hypothetical protein